MEVKRCGEKEFLSADKLRIRENEIHIWCICWPEMTDFWKNHEYILSEQESEQAGKFRFPEDRMRYIAGKLIVRILLKRYLDVETVDFLSMNWVSLIIKKSQESRQSILIFRIRGNSYWRDSLSGWISEWMCRKWQDARITGR